MTTNELATLRQWAAKVCGYEPDGIGEYIREGDSYEYCHMLCDDWLPDQNIAQAFEVLDATLRLSRDYGLSLTGKIGGMWTARVDFRGQVIWNESRCLAIVLACKQAHDALADQTGV